MGAYREGGMGDCHASASTYVEIGVTEAYVVVTVVLWPG